MFSFAFELLIIFLFLVGASAPFVLRRYFLREPDLYTQR